MDRRQFLQTGGALAVTGSPVATVFGQTSWTPPYELPGGGQAISLSVQGANTLNDVATAVNGWGNYNWSFARAAPIYNGYGFGAFAEDYSTAGAMVVAGIGGHHAGGIWGGFIFDFTTGRWISRANANGRTEAPDDPARSSVDWSTGELADKTGLVGQLPIPGHGYLWHFCPPKSIGGGTKGVLIKCCVAAGSDAGWDASRAFQFDLDTGLWTYASNNNIDFDGAYLNPYTDGGGAWDPLTNRFYTPQHGAYTGELRYLDKTSIGWTWRKVSCPNLRNAGLCTAFVEGRNLVLGYMDYAWQKVNLDNIGSGASQISMANATFLSGYFYTRFHRYPVDGCWYALRGTANRASISSWPSDGSPPATQAVDQFVLKIDPTTWTVTRVPISGGIVALWESRWTSTPPHGNAFVYVPQLQCFAWFPRHDTPVQLIKPPSAGTPVGDTQPPFVPANLRVTAAATSSLTWAWNASTDNGGGSVAGYRVSMYDSNDAAIVGPVDAGNVLTYTANALAPGTTYKLRVCAYDNATPANVSTLSGAVAGNTSAAVDGQPPTVPAGLHVTSTTSSSITWAWSASTDTGGGSVAGYKVAFYDNGGVQIGGLVDVGNVLTYTRSTGLSPATTYWLCVNAYDNATPINESSLSTPVAGTTSIASDTQAPTVPAGLRVAATTASSIEWAWSASTDNGGGSVAGYKVALYDGSNVQIGGLVDVGPALGYTRSGLNSATTYKLRVSAYDNAVPVNESALCVATAGTTTSVADTQAPTVPTTLRVKGVTASTITWTWNASTDNGGGSVAGYRVALYDNADAQIDGLVDVGNTRSYKARNLSSNTTYKLRVRAYDNAVPRNESALCAAVAGVTKKTR